MLLSISNMILNKKIRRTTLLCVFFFSLLIGLFLSKYTQPLSVSWLILIALFLPLLLDKKEVILLYLVLAGGIIGWWRGGLLQTQSQPYKEHYYQKVKIIARSTEDSFYAKNSQMQFTVEKVILNGQKLPGKIQVRGYGEPMVYRHDLVEVEGKLYPGMGSKQAFISYAQLNVIARANSPIDDFRRQFTVGMENALPEPAASFAIGLLVGQRSLMTEEVSTVLLAVGLTHIVAVSGYNLTIIIEAVRRALKRLSRFQILFVASGLIYLFLLITGFSPSIVRAGIVSMLSLVAWYFGRRFRAILLILLAAAITGFANPYYVWGDVGWYLSFLAFFGVLIIAPLITSRFFKKKKPPIIGQVAIESFSAQIMVLPYIMYIFGRVSLIGFLSNIIVVPMVPYAMFFSVFAGIAGMIAPAIAGWVAIPARIVLDVMLWLSAWFSQWPITQANVGISIINLLIFYAIIIVFVLALKKRFSSVKIKSKN
jgi:competence protein ComEC